MRLRRSVDCVQRGHEIFRPRHFRDAALQVVQIDVEATSVRQPLAANVLGVGLIAAIAVTGNPRNVPQQQTAGLGPGARDAKLESR